MKKTLIILFLTIILISLEANCQTKKIEPLSTKELNDQILLLLKNKKIFKSLITKDYQGDSAIFIEVNSFQEFYKPAPILNDKFKMYFWKIEDLFFYDVLQVPQMKLIHYNYSIYQSNFEFLIRSKKMFYINVQFQHYDWDRKSKIATRISNLEIRKIKK